MSHPSKHWCFTLNNYTPDDVARLDALPCAYLVYGRETGASGTPHLQGYVRFEQRIRFHQVRTALGGQAHLERMRGTPVQAAAYCKKDGDFTERGDPPSGAPASKFEDVKAFALDVHSRLGRSPNQRELANEFPHHFVRYQRALLEYCRLVCPEPSLELGDPNDWQLRLRDELLNGPDDRTIKFVVDEAGGKGKTWFQRMMITKYPEDVQILSGGKRDDIAHAIDASKKIFLFNVPRGGMEFLQYTILEQIKDRMVFSPKYNSQMKILAHKAHVVVFSNEMPDMNKMTHDRYEFFEFGLINN